MNFKVGQKVVCVDDSPGRVTGDLKLKRGEIYQILGIDFVLRRGEFGLKVFPEDPFYWGSKRFRPVDEQFGENVCKEIEESFLKEELVCR